MYDEEGHVDKFISQSNFEESVSDEFSKFGIKIIKREYRLVHFKIDFLIEYEG